MRKWIQSLKSTKLYKSNPFVQIVFFWFGSFALLVYFLKFPDEGNPETNASDSWNSLSFAYILYISYPFSIVYETYNIRNRGIYYNIPVQIYRFASQEYQEKDLNVCAYKLIIRPLIFTLQIGI